MAFSPFKPNAHTQSPPTHSEQDLLDFEASLLNKHPSSGLITPPSAPDVLHFPGFIPPESAIDYFMRLKTELSFRADQMMINGQDITARRQIDYRADADAPYAYSGSLHTPASWTPALAELRNLVQAHTHEHFNACLCNFYESGAVGMGWHADKERELGSKPKIASLSFGAPRTFVFRRRKPWRDLEGQVGTPQEVEEGKRLPYQKWVFLLNPGDLIIMQGSTQQFFEHALMPTTKVLLPRINLTFRQVLTISG